VVVMTEFLNALYKGDLSRDMRERSEARRAAAPEVAPALAGDQAALSRLATANPDMALKIATMLQSADARTQAQAKTRMELAGRLAAGVLGAPPAQQPAAYMAALEQARAAGLDTSKYPQTWDPAAKAWLEHAARTLGTTSQLFKRMGAGGGGAPSGAVPARGGFGGPPMPAAGGAPRVSAAPVPAGPMVADASGALPPPDAPAAPPMPQIAAAPPPGAGSMPMDLPPPPQIAPPTQTADGGPVTQRFNPGSPAMLGRDEVPAPRPAEGYGADPRIAQDFGLLPGEMYGTKKNGDIVVEGDRVMVRTRDRGDVMRLIPKAQPVAGPPKPADARRDPDAAWSVFQQVPPGWSMAKGADGLPSIDKNGRYLIVEIGPDGKPNGNFDAIEPKKAAGAGAARYEDVKDDKGRLIGQRRADTNEYKPIDRNAGGAGRPLPQKSIDDLGGAGAAAQEFSGLLSTFDDSFGGSWSGTLGDLDNLAKRNLPDGFGGADPKGQADWWSRYQNQKNLIRNRLFGSALTATEKAEFDKANIDPGMKADVIRKNLARQSDAALRAAAKMARALEASGYNREAIEAAIGIPLGSLPSPTAKPLPDQPRAGGVTVPMPGGAPATGGNEKPPLIYDKATGDFR
jgi:hypothetical protein